ncbi:SH3 domain-containing protein [Ovoidimarina sediminis]|uniref:SH3 domain-containing protein n=1 Tax=Ovoidimarina sediminis TaxID=3079856 RepID=UPI00290B645D|nr:SH3 domain-containing protein [Rhodophyticola sp. MJ-SS7]MDU8946017.1 SH3 domain-containing protein [Rhodophyticola sp. MJ-SS7]
MIRSTANAAAAALIGACLGAILPAGPASAQETSEFIAKMKRNFGTGAAPIDGITEAEAVQIALNRGAAIRMAREEGIALTPEQVRTVGLEPLELAALAPLAAAPAPEPAPAPALSKPDPEAETVAAEAAPAGPLVLTPEQSPRPRARPLTLAAVVADTPAPDDTTSISTSGETLFWRVTAERVNLRAGPGTQHDVVTQLDSDDQVLALSDTAADWIEIQLPRDGTTAWISARFLAPADG